MPTLSVYINERTKQALAEKGCGNNTSSLANYVRKMLADVSGVEYVRRRNETTRKSGRNRTVLRPSSVRTLDESASATFNDSKPEPDVIEDGWDGGA